MTNPVIYRDQQFDSWSIILVQNRLDSEVESLLYHWIRIFSKSLYNHCQLIRSINGQLYVFEATGFGFRCTKSFDDWIKEDLIKQRTIKVLQYQSTVGEEQRFSEVLKCPYNYNYFGYLFYYATGKWIFSKNPRAKNCFQSLGYVLGVKDWYNLDGKYFESL